MRTISPEKVTHTSPRTLELNKLNRLTGVSYSGALRLSKRFLARARATVKG